MARPIVYCALPRDLAPKLHELLRRHFRADPRVEVIVEQRSGERRHGRDRRTASAVMDEDRRTVHSREGRRVADRRATVIDIDPPELPRRARRFADRLMFVERLEPSSQRLEDFDTARLVIGFQAGGWDLFATLYMRYFERVYSYLRILLRDSHEAEDAAQDVFLKAFEALPRYQLREVPFRGWLFTIARNHALNRLESGGKQASAVEPAEAQRRRELVAPCDPPSSAWEWISDRELLLFVERLPLGQRQVLLLRYMHDLPYQQIAEILGRTPNEVRKLHQRATTQLRARLAAIGREPRRSDRAQWQRRPTFLGVIRARRYALWY